MSYFYNCPHCNRTHGVDPNTLAIWSNRPRRVCHDCGQDGCVDCIPDAEGLSLCEECFDRRDDHSRSLAPVDTLDV